MGYELRITRDIELEKQTDKRISEDEWKSLVAIEQDMGLTGVAEITTPDGFTITYTNPLLAVWAGHLKYEKIWFDYFEGSISVNNPDEIIIEKMIELAKKLDARVQGDDGELYD